MFNLTLITFFRAFIEVRNFKQSRGLTFNNILISSSVSITSVLITLKKATRARAHAYMVKKVQRRGWNEVQVSRMQVLTNEPI